MTRRTPLFAITALLAVMLPASTAHAAPPKCFNQTATKWGNSGPNVIYGTSGADVIAGLGGGDTIIGRGGNDLICGGGGGDGLRGGGGNDTIFDESGNDLIYGEDGRDLLVAGPGNDQYAGGRGFDNLTYTLAPKAVLANLGSGNASGHGSDGMGQIEHLTGSIYNDKLIGNGAPNILTGGNGADELRAAGANDTVYGGSGNDKLFGMDGNDLLNGMDGDDTLEGGPGTDQARFDFAGGGVTASIDTGTATGAAGSDTLLTIENLWGSPYTDVLTGDANANRLEGNGYDDTLNGLGGNDILIGGTNSFGGTGDTANGGDGTSDLCDAEFENDCEGDPPT